MRLRDFLGRTDSVVVMLLMGCESVWRSGVCVCGGER
jgi:hypothetical protein